VCGRTESNFIRSYPFTIANRIAKGASEQESTMNASIKKTLATGLVALTLAGSLAAAPAQAKPFPHPHHGFGGWGIAGLLGGIALGGAIAASTAPSYDCGTVRQAVVDQYGNFIGYRYVSAC
jgi:hypothetical protein